MENGKPMAPLSLPRNRMLAENYLFRCDCTKCQDQQDDPDVTSDEEMSDEEESD